jgi:type IV pilus assembly protein PilC
LPLLVNGHYVEVKWEIKMPTYVFKGRNRLNEIVVGERVAADRGALEAMLRREQVILTNAREKGREISLPKVGRERVKSKDLALFTRQFSVMLDAGLPLVQCLEILGQQQDNKFFQKVIFQTRADVEAGMTLADAMAKHPRVFEPLYTNMVAAGETGGILDVILQRLSTYLEKMVKLKSDVKSALIYPIAVIVISIIVISIIMIVVIPAFKNIFEGLLGPGERLPWLTELVVSISQFMASYWWLIALVVGIAVFAAKTWYKTERGQHVIDSVILRLPVLGPIMRKIAVARFSRTLSTLLSSGVPILESLEITSRTAGNIIVSEAIQKVRSGIEQGQTFVEPLKASGVFPIMVSQMIGVGEQTGALDAMLSKIADFYEQEVDAAIANLLALMEPAMIMFLGVTIGTIVIAMYLPLFTLIGKLAGGH